MSTRQSFRNESGSAPGGAAGLACWSPDRRYRWSLRRAWPPAGPHPGPSLTFVMLNPSTAGATRDDASIRRCRGFAEREGCSSFEVVNLFALVSTDPRGLLADPDPVGFACDQAIVSACTGRDDRTVVVAWGANAGHPRLRPRALQVLELLDGHQVPCQVLGITADGHPAHPLRLSRNAPLRPRILPAPHRGNQRHGPGNPAGPTPSIAGQGVSESPGSRAAGAT